MTCLRNSKNDSMIGMKQLRGRLRRGAQRGHRCFFIKDPVRPCKDFRVCSVIKVIGDSSTLTSHDQT